MRLYSYIVRNDTGFAPNPFFGYCTLACCKPAIRRTAKVGDWIVGLTPKANGNKIVYAMKVEETLSFSEYNNDGRFKQKIPDDRGDAAHQCGDNIYVPRCDGSFRQLSSRHSLKNGEDEEQKGRDLRGQRVLVSSNFKYFGSNAVDLPERFNGLIPGRGHRCRFPDELVTKFLDYMSQLPNGVHAAPRKWPSQDNSWTPRS